MRLFPSKNIWRLVGENSEKKFVCISFFFSFCYILPYWHMLFFLLNFYQANFSSRLFPLENHITPYTPQKIHRCYFSSLYNPTFPSKIIHARFYYPSCDIFAFFQNYIHPNAFLLLSSFVNTHHFWRTFFDKYLPFSHL